MAFFKSLKSHFINETSIYIQNNPSKKLGRLQCGAFLGKAWGKAANQNNGRSRFCAPGIFPPNGNTIPEYAFNCDLSPRRTRLK